MLNKLRELESQTTVSSEGALTGRGRGRKKKQVFKPECSFYDKGDITQDKNDGCDTNRVNKQGQLHITRTNKKKINKFIQDLKSMMDGIFEDVEDDNLSEEEKSNCQKLLLTISVKAKIFTEDQRNTARLL